MTNFYYYLRKAEQVKGAINILVTDLEEYQQELEKEDLDYFDALYDKMFRSCSGQSIHYSEDGEPK